MAPEGPRLLPSVDLYGQCQGERCRGLWRGEWPEFEAPSSPELTPSKLRKKKKERKSTLVMRVGHEWLQGVLSHPRSGSTLGVSRYSRSTVYERVRYPYILTEHGELPFTFGVRAPKFSSFLATALAKTRSPSKDELPHVVLTKKKKKSGHRHIVSILSGLQNRPSRPFSLQQVNSAWHGGSLQDACTSPSSLGHLGAVDPLGSILPCAGSIGGGALLMIGSVGWESKKIIRWGDDMTLTKDHLER